MNDNCLRFNLDMRCSNEHEFHESSSSSPSSKEEEEANELAASQPSPSIEEHMHNIQKTLLFIKSQNLKKLSNAMNKSKRMRNLLATFLSNYRQFSQIHHTAWSELDEILDLIDSVLRDIEQNNSSSSSSKTEIKNDYPIIRLYTDEYFHVALFFALKVEEITAGSPASFCDRMTASYPLLRIMDIELDHLADEQRRESHGSNSRFSGTLYRGEYWSAERLKAHSEKLTVLPLLMREYVTLSTVTSTSTDDGVALRFMKKTPPKSGLFNCFLTFRVFTVDEELLKRFRNAFPEYGVLEDVVVDISDKSAFVTEKEYLLRENSINQTCGCKKFIFSQARDATSFNIHICVVNARLLNCWCDNRDSKICANIFERIINYTLLKEVFSEYSTVREANLMYNDETINKYYTQIQSYFDKFENYFDYLNKSIVDTSSNSNAELLSLARERLWNNMILVRYLAVDIINNDKQKELKGLLVRRLTRMKNNLEIMISQTSKQLLESVAHNALCDLLKLLNSEGDEWLSKSSYTHVLTKMMRSLDIEYISQEDDSSVLNAQRILERLLEKSNQLIQTSILNQLNDKQDLFMSALKEMYEGLKVFKTGFSTKNMSVIQNFMKYSGQNREDDMSIAKESKVVDETPNQSTMAGNDTAWEESNVLEEIQQVGASMNERFKDTSRNRYELMDQLIDPILLDDSGRFASHLEEYRSSLFDESNDRFHSHCHTISSRVLFAVFVLCLVNCTAADNWGVMKWTIM